MARTGLGAGWRCLLANDIDPKKTASYVQNFGGGEILTGDVAGLASRDAPGRADLAWASFPCQDLSLAGGCRGLGAQGSNVQSRSGAFWPFWSLVQGLRLEGRAPRVVVLENVVGLLTSRGGADFAALVSTLLAGGYRPGVLQIDARLFLPQSRPRLFIIAVREDLAIPVELSAATPDEVFTPPALAAALARLPAALAGRLLFFRLPPPSATSTRLQDLLEIEPADAPRHPPHVTRKLLASMSPANLAKLEEGARDGVAVGALYKRTRRSSDGSRIVRAEVRFDGLAGCLRTPVGGSSRQMLLFLGDGAPWSRLLSRREAARLMGLPESYQLPARCSDALHLLGDGVCPPIVRHLAEHLLEPLLARAEARRLEAAE